jgi:hypothetical protein
LKIESAVGEHIGEVFDNTKSTHLELNNIIKNENEDIGGMKENFGKAKGAVV